MAEIPAPLESDSTGITSNRMEAASEPSCISTEVFVGLENAFQSLAPQSVTLEQRISYVLASIAAIVILSASVPALWFGRQAWWVPPLVVLGWGLLGALLIWFSHFWPKQVYRHASWRLLDSGLEIRRGVWWQHRIAIPVARVQHVDVSQGPLQRMFDLGKLTIHTAGTTNASVELDGLAHGQAMQLRDLLIEQKESLDVL